MSGIVRTQPSQPRVITGSVMVDEEQKGTRRWRSPETDGWSDGTHGLCVLDVAVTPCRRPHPFLGAQNSVPEKHRAWGSLRAGLGPQGRPGQLPTPASLSRSDRRGPSEGARDRPPSHDRAVPAVPPGGRGTRGPQSSPSSEPCTAPLRAGSQRWSGERKHP